MKSKNNKLEAAFAVETRFELTPTPPGPFRTVLATEFERVQHGFLVELLRQGNEPDLNLLYRHAVSEAGALAAATDYPMLVLPLLLDEKAAAARKYLRQQNRIRERSAHAAQSIVA